MRITAIRQKTIALAAPMRNAGIAYDEMTASVVVVETDGPHVGLGVDSIGRYGHGGLLEERFAPRLVAAEPGAYAGETGIDPMRAWDVVMANEKPGGHGERAGAVGLLDAALWDLAAKAAEVPLWRLIADRFNGGAHHPRVPVYASGGHYRDGGIPMLAEEVTGWRDAGYRRFKIKIGGASLDEDRARLEAVLGVAGSSEALAIDGNGTFDLATAQAYMALAGELGLAWVEEPASPLDFRAHAMLAANHAAPIGAGENIFSAMDTRNLLRHGGLRPDRDRLQMDISLSYGLPEYLRMLALAEATGWPRDAFVPHAGHLFAFHVVAGLGLGLHECAPDDGEIYGGLPPGTALTGGACALPDAPGAGIETKANLYAVFGDLLA